jgi:hypothetical protein
MRRRNIVSAIICSIFAQDFWHSIIVTRAFAPFYFFSNDFSLRWWAIKSSRLGRNEDLDVRFRPIIVDSRIRSMPLRITGIVQSILCVKLFLWCFRRRGAIVRMGIAFIVLR